MKVSLASAAAASIASASVVGAIRLENRVSRRAEPLPRLLGEAGDGRLHRRQRDAGSDFVGVPARQQRHGVLLAGRVDLRRRLRQHVAVDVRREPLALERRLQHLVGRLRAQRRQIGRAEPGGELRPCLLGGHRPRCSAAAAQRKNAPLSPIARWISPLASGDTTSALTANEPADSPKIVTLPGSPPKAAMLSCTHCSAAT